MHCRVFTINSTIFALSGLFDEDNIPWLLEMLQSDVFENAEKITKEQFFQVRGDSMESNTFWKVVSQIAVEKFNIKEVFNMTSTVRLAAIERLGEMDGVVFTCACLSVMHCSRKCL